MHFTDQFQYNKIFWNNNEIYLMRDRIFIKDRFI